jgi:glycosyltransferase involved in cell wall biosynthesis
VRTRVAVTASHPIPYQAPLFAELARRAELEVMVFFGDDYGKRPRSSAWGIRDFVWQGELTEGYPHVFLANWAPRPHPSTFAGKLNPGLIPAVMRFRPDALLLSGYASLYHWQSLVAGALCNAKILYFADSSRAPQPGSKGKLKHAVLSRLYERIDAFLVIGRKNHEHYLAYGVPEEKFFSFPYSVGNARFRRQADELRERRTELREAFGVPEGATCVVYVGRLSPEKNVAELIQGVQGAADNFLLVVGSGPEQRELEALAARVLPGRYRFAGFLNQDRLGEVYTAADMMALPSRYEPWGLVCNEAMNFGLPLVVSDCVGAGPDLVISGETGFVYPLGDSAALSRALEGARRMLLRDPDGVRSAVLRRVDLYSETAQARGVLRALGVEPHQGP